MKKQLFGIISFALVIASMLMTSCTKEEGNIYRLKVHQYTSADKTSLGTDGTTLWSDGDKIYVNGVDANHTLTVSGTGSNYQTTVSENVLDEGRLYCFYAGNTTLHNTQGYTQSERKFKYGMSSGYIYDASKLNAPMVGVSRGNDVNFENVCSMLKLVFPYNIGPITNFNTTNSIVHDRINNAISITSDGTAIAGNFAVRYNDDDGWMVNFEGNGANTDVQPANKKITIGITSPVSVIYVPIPAGLHKLTFEGNYFKREMREAKNFEKNTIYTIDFGNMPKTFSVSSSKKVVFASGNLQKTTEGFQFAEQPEDYMWTGNTNNSGIADLFFQNFTHATIPSINENSIEIGGTTWYVPSSDEWQYLLGTFGANNTDNTHRKSSYYLCQRAQINGKNGIVILPDNFVIPANITWRGQIYSLGYTDITTYWQSMRAAGAIFLPAAGYFTANTTYNSLGNTTNGQSARYASSNPEKNLMFTGNISSSSTTIKISPSQPGSDATTKYAVAFRLYKEAQ